MENDVISDINKKFTLDELDNWETATGLIQSVVSYVEQNLRNCAAHVFFHECEFHEYREIDREGITSIPDDSIFIGCMSMVDGIMSLQRVFSDFHIDEPLIEQCLSEIYQGKYIVPVVHRFKLLAFILVCQKDNEKGIELSPEQTKELLAIADRLKTNLYAASVADRQQRQLLRLSSFPQTLKAHISLDEIYSSLLKDLTTQIDFSSGVCYAFEEETGLLIPVDKQGIDGNVNSVHMGRGISGQAADRGKIIIVPERESHPTYSIMAEESFITGSFLSVPFGTTKELYGVLTLCRKTPFGAESRYMMEIAASLIASEIANRELLLKLEESNFNVVKSLASALEAKDANTEGHSARVAKYSVNIAKLLGYNETRLHDLKYGAMLHDIGKIGITDAIINKDGKLTDEEYTTIKGHTEIGYRILGNNPFFEKIRTFVRYHHETLIGTGYYKKKLGEYPEEAMIISCADIFDALISDRPYRKALPIEVALTELKKLIGIHFTEPIYLALKQYTLTFPLTD